MRSTSRVAARLGLLVSVSIFATPSLGQPAAAPGAPSQAKPAGVEEIVVTARRQKERLQDVPVSITALTSKDIHERSVGDVVEAANFVPNAYITTGAGNSNSPGITSAFIRGIGQTDFIITSDPGVGLYVDGVYVARSTGGTLDLSDVERIEVLRGPQGTLFGKNTIGGALNITTRKPNHERVTGDFEAIYGSYNRAEGRGFVSGPLNDWLAAKAAITYKRSDGYGYRLAYPSGRRTGVREGGYDDAIARLGLDARLGDELTANASFDYTRNRDEAVPAKVVVVGDGGTGLLSLYNALVAGPQGIPVTPALNNTGRFENYSRGPNFSNQDIYGGQFTLEWNKSPFTVRSISGYRHVNSFVGRDGDQTPADLLGSTYRLRQSQISEEVQILGRSFDNRLSWLLGAYYLHENGKEPQNGWIARGLYQALGALPVPLPCLNPATAPPICATNPQALYGLAPGGPGNPANVGLDLDFLIYNAQKVDSYALFTQDSFQLTDKLSLTAGLRYTSETKNLLASITKAGSGAVVVAPINIHNNYHSVSPRIGLEYKAGRDTLLYAYAAQGFKSGGFNGRSLSAAGFRSFAPETVWTYEAGFKSEFANHRVRLNGAAFYNDYRDIQTQLIKVSASGTDVFTVNAAKARAIGGELELTARPVPRLEISGALGFIDQRYLKVDPATGLTTKSKFVRTPKWTADASIQYRFPLGSHYELTPRADLSYRSKVYNDVTNAEYIAQKGFALLNLRLTLSQLNGPFEAAVFVRNATDVDYITGALTAVPNGFGIYNVQKGGLPRTFGGSVRYRF